MTALDKTHIDHHLQAEIMRRLAFANEPVRFTDLKEEGIENSLFMYHLNKLISKKLVDKSDDGFTLTAEGANWANIVGVGNFSLQLTPIPLVQMLIKSADKILIAHRKGQTAKLLNNNLLPGGPHRYGSDAMQNVQEALQSCLPGAQANFKLLTVADVIVTTKQDFTHHSISHIYECQLAEMVECDTTNLLYGYEWVNYKDAVNNMDIPLLVLLDQKITDDKLFINETFIIK